METENEHKQSSDELLTRRELLTICAQLSVAGAVAASVVEAASASTSLHPLVPVAHSSFGPNHTTSNLAPMKKAASVVSLAEYVQVGMSHTSVNQILVQRGVSIRGLKLLKMAGIQTALDLDQHPAVPEIPTEEWQSMKAWCDSLKSRIAAEYHAGWGLPYPMLLGCNPAWDGSRSTNDALKWWTHDEVEGKQI